MLGFFPVLFYSHSLIKNNDQNPLINFTISLKTKILECISEVLTSSPYHYSFGSLSFPLCKVRRVLDQINSKLWGSVHSLGRRAFFVGFPSGTMVKNPSPNAGDTWDSGSNSELGRCPGGGNSNPFQYSCLESSMGRGSWWAAVHEVAESNRWVTEHSPSAQVSL